MLMTWHYTVFAGSQVNSRLAGVQPGLLPLARRIKLRAFPIVIELPSDYRRTILSLEYQVAGVSGPT